MSFYKRLIINGTEYRLAVGQSGKGAPGSATLGAVGMTYMDTDTGALYKCTAAENGVYTWEDAGNEGELSAESIREALGYTPADAGSLPAFEKIGGGDSGGDEPDEPDEPEDPIEPVGEEYNLITLATEVSTAEEFLAFDGLALLKEYEYNAVSTVVNTDDKYWVLKVPVQSGDVIRCNTVSYWQKTTVTAAYQYIGFYDANGTHIEPVRLSFDGHATMGPTYLDIRENGVAAPDGSAYALVNVYRDYYVNDTTQYKNGFAASIVTLNADASLTAYDGTAELPAYVPVAERSSSAAVASVSEETNAVSGEDTSTEVYYQTVDDVRIPRYETALGNIESVLANVVGGV